MIVPISSSSSGGQQGNVLTSLLAQGGATLSSILSNSFQDGRNQVNLQAQQERDFQTERRRETNLRQRRADFNEGRRRFDASFGEGQRQFNVSEQGRAEGRALQARGQSLNFLLGGERNALAEEGLKLQEQAATQSKLESDFRIDLNKLKAEDIRAERTELGETKKLATANNAKVNELLGAFNNAPDLAGKQKAFVGLSDPTLGVSATALDNLGNLAGAGRSVLPVQNGASIDPAELDPASSAQLNDVEVEIDSLRRKIAGTTDPKEVSALRDRISEQEGKRTEIMNGTFRVKGRVFTPNPNDTPLGQ